MEAPYASPACRICGNARGNARFRAREMQFGTREEFDYFRCASCGCLQISEVPEDLAGSAHDGYLAAVAAQALWRPERDAISRGMRQAGLRVVMLKGAALAGWLATLLLAWLLSLLLSGAMMRVGVAASRHTAGSFFLGLVSAPFLLVVGAFVVLAAAVVGASLAWPVLVLGLLLPWVGQVAGTYVLGCKLMGRRPGESRLMAPVFVGSLVVALIFLAGVALSVPAGLARSLSLFFAMLGVLVIGVLSTIGVGAMLIAPMGARPSPAAPGVPPVPAQP